MMTLSGNFACSLPTTYEFNQFAKKHEGGESFFFDKGYFIGGQFDFSKLTERAQETMEEIGYLNPDFINNGWANLIFSQCGENKSTHEILFEIKKFISQYTDWINFKFQLINIDFNTFSTTVDSGFKLVLAKKMITSNQVIMTFDEWKIFLNSSDRFKHANETEWFLTSTVKRDKIVLIRKKEGKIDTKMVSIVEDTIKCKLVFVMRQSHLKEQVAY